MGTVWILREYAQDDYSVRGGWAEVDSPGFRSPGR
jgi:hypothetical protein